MSNTAALGLLFLSLIVATVSALLALLFGLRWWTAFLIYTGACNACFGVLVVAIADRSVWFSLRYRCGAPAHDDTIAAGMSD